MKKVIVTVSIINLLIAAGLLYFFLFMKKMPDQIVMPYIAHQTPRVDPHVPATEPLSDKLDEVIFEGLFNISANPSGIIYEDGLGELISKEGDMVTIRLKPSRKWHSSFSVVNEKGKVTVDEKAATLFTARDLRFTLQRIKKLGSLSPDYILVAQAVPDFDFSGPDDDGYIQFKFKKGREWLDGDIKEILSFKVIPGTSDMNAAQYLEGTGPYMYAGEYEDVIQYTKNPADKAQIKTFKLKPYIDNSTYTTELKNYNINSLLATPFGSISPILADTSKFFYKSSIATSFFSLYFNVNRLDRSQRKALRALIDNRKVMNRFFRVGTEQQRSIANYKGDGNNYEEYLNFSVFPASSYYVAEQIVTPFEDSETDPGILPDTVRISTCLNYGFREELADLVEILNDPALFNGKIKVSAVDDSEIRSGNYDAVLVPVSGYRSNFLFDLYNVFLREPSFETQRINLQTVENSKKETVAHETSLTENRNFFRMDIKNGSSEDSRDFATLLEYIYGFMSTQEVGDKQAYAQYIHELESDLALGEWLFSLPSLAYFRTQFDKETIDLYGTASQLSTIEKWSEKKKK